MSTEPYAMVRGRVIRVTALSACGAVPDEPGQYGVASCVARVAVNEVIEAGGNEVIRDEQEQAALHFVKDPEVLGHTADIDFIRVDPGILSLVSGNPLIVDWDDPDAVIGFDQNLRLRANTAFALEVWSYLAGQTCAPGERKWGYTIFPFLKGGYLGNFEFANGAVTFKLQGAQSRWGAKWASGPFDIFEDLPQPAPITQRTSWRNFIYTGTPPEPTDGIQTFTDVIEGGSASVTTADIVDGGSASSTTPDIVEGGSAT